MAVVAMIGMAQRRGATPHYPDRAHEVEISDIGILRNYAVAEA
jgi:hypothetical protein